MPMTERVKMLRQQSLDTLPALSVERAELLTRFYREQSAGPGLVSAPVRWRAWNSRRRPM